MKHTEIKLILCCDLDSAIKKLHEHRDRGELVYGVFNGQKLYSDTDDIDSAYKKVTGMTKAEFDKAERIRDEQYEAEKKMHEESTPQLTEEWIEKGKSILDAKYHETWNRCVPIRLSDLYRGMELGATLDIVKELNSGCALDKAKSIIDAQGHSGMSFGLVCSMVKSFCDRGSDFVEYIRPR